MTEKMPLAFFSYSRSDSDFVLKLGQDLKANDAPVWLDQLDIDPGRRWDDAVQEALSQCQRLLVVLSPTSVESTNVMDEVSYALEEKKLVIPVLYRDCTIPFRLRRVQHVDFRSDYRSGLSHLLTVLRAEALRRAEPIARAAARVGTVHLELPQKPEERRGPGQAESERRASQNSETASKALEGNERGGGPSRKKFWLIGAVASIGAVGGWGVSEMNSSKPTVDGNYGKSTVNSGGRDAAKAGPKEPHSPKAPDAPRAGGSLVGNWRNENSGTRNITRMDVGQDGDRVTVHAWGKCHPSDCDWGTERGLASADSASITWDQGFVLRQWTIRREADRLRLEEDSVYRDSRSPQHLEEFFVRSQ